MKVSRQQERRGDASIREGLVSLPLYVAKFALAHQVRHSIVIEWNELARVVQHRPDSVLQPDLKAP